MPIISAKNRGTAEWDPTLKRAKVTKIKGNYFTTLGFNYKSEYFLYPEEVLFLVNKGALNFFHNQLCLNFDQTLLLLLDESDLKFKDYQCYQYLKSLGYIVRRLGSSTSSGPTPITAQSNRIDFQSYNICQLNNLQSNLLNNIWSMVPKIQFDHKFPLIKSKHFSHIDEVFKELDIVQQLNHGQLLDNDTVNMSHCILQSDKLPFSYQVFKPNQQFKRSQVNCPDYLIYTLDVDEEGDQLNNHIINELTQFKNAIGNRIEIGVVIVKHQECTFLKLQQLQFI